MLKVTRDIGHGKGRGLSQQVEFDADKLAFVARIAKQSWIEDSAKPGAQAKPKKVIKPTKRPTRPKKLVKQEPTKQPNTK